MVAQTIELPNIRKMFVPDPGYEIVDCDLAGVTVISQGPTRKS